MIGNNKKRIINNHVISYSLYTGFSCMAILLSLLMVLVAVGVGVYFFCESDKTNALCVDIHWGLDQVRNEVQRQIKQWQK